MDQNRRVKRTVRVTCTQSVKEVRFVNPAGSPRSCAADGVISEAYSTITEIVVHEGLQDDSWDSVDPLSQAPLLLPRLLPVEAAEDSYPPQSSALCSAEPRFFLEPRARYEAPYAMTEPVDEHEGSRIRRPATPYRLDKRRHSPRSLPHPQFSEPSDRSQYYSPTPRTPFSPSSPVWGDYLDPEMPTDNGHYHAHCASPTDESYEPLLGLGYGTNDDSSESPDWLAHHSVPQEHFPDRHSGSNAPELAERVPFDRDRHRDTDYSRPGSPPIFCQSTGEFVPNSLPPPSCDRMVHARYSGRTHTRPASRGGRQYEEGRNCAPAGEDYGGALDYCGEAMAQSLRYRSDYPVDAARYRTL